MAALRSSPAAAALRASAVPVSSSLRGLLSIRRCRLPFLKLSPSSSRRYRRGAAGAAMMDTVASSYANALADVAKSHGTLDATVADMEKVDSVFADPAVQSFFADPTVATEKKYDLVKEVVLDGGLQPYTSNFLNILVDMNRIDIIHDVVEEFEASYNRITGTEMAVVTSVVEMGVEELSQIAQFLKKFTGAKNVRVKTMLDPSLIAGFTIRFGSSGSKLIDMSTKKQIDEIMSQLDLSISLV